MKTILLQAVTTTKDDGSHPWVGFLIFVAIVGFIIYRIISAKNKLAKKTGELKFAYDTALRGNNKKAALDAGRAYFGFIRPKGRLTIYDEQRLTNDINAMNV